MKNNKQIQVGARVLVDVSNTPGKEQWEPGVIDSAGAPGFWVVAFDKWTNSVNGQKYGAFKSELIKGA